MTATLLGNIKGPKGDTGKGIQSITKTGTSGLVDTYTITYTNGDTTTYTLTNAPSPGTFTDLQQAVTYETDNGILILNKDYKYNSTTDSSLSGGIEITQDIVIIGNGHIIDGNNYARAFIDTNGYTWELNDLKIQNCTSDNCRYGIDDGGAIYANTGATVNINNTQFNQNTANYGHGGAIRTGGNCNLTVTNCTFNNNTATNGNGGAIFTQVDYNLTVTNCAFNKNDASDGGAIYIDYTTTVTMKNSNFRNNTATDYEDIYSGDEITVYDCIISDISTSCYNVTNITIESLVDMIGDAITYINQ